MIRLVKSIFATVFIIVCMFVVCIIGLPFIYATTYIAEQLGERTILVMTVFILFVLTLKSDNKF